MSLSSATVIDKYQIYRTNDNILRTSERSFGPDQDPKLEFLDSQQGRVLAELVKSDSAVYIWQCSVQILAFHHNSLVLTSFESQRHMKNIPQFQFTGWCPGLSLT